MESTLRLCYHALFSNCFKYQRLFLTSTTVAITVLSFLHVHARRPGLFVGIVVVAVVVVMMTA